jgi:hypothetical protein
LVLPTGADYYPVEADLGGVFTLRGYALDAPAAVAGQPLGITLYWEVGERSMPQPAPTRGEPISAFVHLVDGDPANQVAQADGWEVALTGLEPRDVIAQRFTLEIGPEVPAQAYALLAGLYSPQDGARLPVLQGGQPAADHVSLGAIQVTDSPPNN